MKPKLKWERDEFYYTANAKEGIYFVEKVRNDFILFLDNKGSSWFKGQYKTVALAKRAAEINHRDLPPNEILASFKDSGEVRIVTMKDILRGNF